MVVVLPFKNLSGDAGQDYFSDGITEDVIGALGRFSNLLVAAKSASYQFKGRDVAPAEIGRVLDARYLLGGSVRRAGDRVRVNVELTDAETGRHLWSETYDAELKDIFALQDDIARRVVGAAAAKLTRFEQERVLAKPTSSLAAYEYVLRGRDRTVTATREQNDASREMFQRAIDLDPTYAAAYAALGGTYFDAVVSGWTEFRAAVPNAALYFAPGAAWSRSVTSSTLSTAGRRRGSRTIVSRRARSGRSSVTLKKKRRAATVLLMLGGCMPVCVWCSWKRRKSSAVAVSGDRPMKAANARTLRT
jgi:TolB-like protein